MKDYFVYRRTGVTNPTEIYLGEFLGIVPIVYQDGGQITTDNPIYYVRSDGTVGFINRVDTIIKDKKI